MTESIAPTPERGQHDRVEVEAADRKHVSRSMVVPLHDYWLRKGVIDASQHQAADLYLKDWETVTATAKSSMGSLDRVDNGAAAPIRDERALKASNRIARVEASLGLVAASLLQKILFFRERVEVATGRDRKVGQGMAMMALELLAVVYECKK